MLTDTERKELVDIIMQTLDKEGLISISASLVAPQIVAKVEEFLESRKSFSRKLADAAEEESNLDDPRFDGETYDKELDQKRLARLHFKVFDFMVDEQWHTLRAISQATNIPEGSASAKFRDFRKARWGSHMVDRRRVGIGKAGLWEYRLLPNKDCLTWTEYLKSKHVQR